MSIRIDTVAEGIQQVDLVLDELGKLDLDDLDGAIWSAADYAEAGLGALDATSPLAHYFQEIETTLNAINCPELGVVMDRLKALRAWLNEAQLNYDMELIRARKATRA